MNDNKPLLFIAQYFTIAQLDEILDYIHFKNMQAFSADDLQSKIKPLLVRLIREEIQAESESCNEF